MEFNKKAKDLLKKSGWKLGRNITEEKLELPYNDYPDFVVKFLKEYGNLKIDCDVQDYTEVINELYTDPSIPKEKLEGDNYIPYYQSILKKKLYPIGLYVYDSYDICCDSDGKVYMIGEYCYYRGNNLYEGIENILLGWENCLQLDEDTGKWWNENTEYVELP